MTPGSQPPVVFGWLGALISIALGILLAGAVIAISEPRKVGAAPSAPDTFTSAQHAYRVGEAAE